MRTRSRLMSAGGKGRGKGELTAQVREHRNWSHTLQLPTGPAALQHRPDLWRSQICPSLAGHGSGISSEPPNSFVGPCPLPSPPGPRTAQRLPTRARRGWPSVLLKLALLPVKPRDRPGVRLDGDVTLNGRGLDHSGCLPKPPSWAQKISRAQLPVLGSSSQLVPLCLEPTTLAGCQHHKRGGATRRVPASGHNGEGQAGLDKCDRRPRPACGEGTPRKGRLNSSPCSCCGASVRLPEGSRTWAPFS